MLDRVDESTPTGAYDEWFGSRTRAVLWRACFDGPRQHVLPDAAMDLMWFQGRWVVAGPDTRTMIFDRLPGETTWGLRLPPGWASALFGVPADELTDRRVDLNDLTGPGRLPTFAPAAEDEVPELLERIVVAQRSRVDLDLRTLRLASSLDRAARRGASARQAAGEHAMSERTLRRASSELFGYGFKTLARIHRFQRSLDLCRQGIPLGEVAAIAGYADQAHFTRDCRTFAGVTPTTLTAAA